MQGCSISFDSGGVHYRFKVGIDDQTAAIDAATEAFDSVAGIMIHPLKNGEAEEIGLGDGEIREDT